MSLLLGAIVTLAACQSTYRSYSVPATGGAPGAGVDGRAECVGIPPIRGPFDEVWVIARGDHAAQAPGDEVVRTGTLATVPTGSDEVPQLFPLEATHVQATIEGPIASVRVAQEFGNPFADTIEAVYVFPLPHDAAVSDFTLTIGSRTIRGVIREREEAERIYREARLQGYIASLLTEERPNIFTERVANIEPGQRIEVALTYYNMVPYAHGWHEWRFPLVAGPRFHAPTTDRPVTAVAVGTNASADQGSATAIEYLAPGQQTGRRIALHVDVNAGVALRELECPSHGHASIRRAGERGEVQLDGGEELADRDFVLRWSVAGQAPVSSYVASPQSDGGGIFAFTLYPPRELGEGERMPMELVFVLDRSGSMHGRPIAQAKEAIAAAVDWLGPQDAFQIVEFSERAGSLGPKLVSADAAGKASARRYLQSLDTGGGTLVLEGLEAALRLPHQEGRIRYLIFVTDGLVGNEREIVRAIHRDLGEGRVFAMGVGSAPNWHLLACMARAGQGAVAALPLDENAAQTMSQFMKRVGQPVLSGIDIEWTGSPVTDVWPSRIPDLVADQPVTIFGRYEHSAPTSVLVRGRTGNRTLEVPITLERPGARSPALDKLWARARIAQLADDASWKDGDRDRIVQDITSTALAFGLTSPYTTFIAVDASRSTGGSDRRTIVQPSPMPAGVHYETTVGTGALGGGAKEGQ